MLIVSRAVGDEHLQFSILLEVLFCNRQVKVQTFSHLISKSNFVFKLTSMKLNLIPGNLKIYCNLLCYNTIINFSSQYVEMDISELPSIIIGLHEL